MSENASSEAERQHDAIAPDYAPPAHDAAPADPGSAAGPEGATDAGAAADDAGAGLFAAGPVISAGTEPDFSASDPGRTTYESDGSARVDASDRTGSPTRVEARPASSSGYDYDEQQPGFFARIGRFFKGDSGGPSSGGGGRALVAGGQAKPWTRQGQAIARLESGFTTLTDLMGTIKDNLEAQNRRQDQLIEHLSALPRVLEMLPEASRMQGETLKAIHSQLLHQADQQDVLGEILGKLSEAGTDHRDALDGLKERVENLGEQDRNMASSFGAVGAAMESVSKNSQASAEVLGQVRDNLKSRDAELEKVLHRQASRFTTMLAIAIFLSIAALTAVVVMGYLMMKQMHH